MKILKNSKLKFIIALLLIMFVFSTTVLAEPVVTSEVEDGIEYISEGEDISEEDSNELYEAIMDAINNKDVSESDIYLFQDKVDITSTVSGNAFIIANEVNVNASVDGNMFILANKVYFGSSCYIYSDVFVAANEVDVSGYMYDLYCSANTLSIEAGGCIIRDLHASCNKFEFAGLIRRDAFLATNSIVTDDASAKIMGSLKYSAPENNFPASIVESGTIEYEELKQEPVNIIKNYIEECIYVLILALVVILIIIFAIPKFADKEERLLKNKFGNVIAYGALALLVIPIICVIACFTVVGILPAIILALIYMFMLQVSSSIVAVPVSKMLCSKMNKDSKAIKVLVGMIYVLIMWTLQQIPFINIVVNLANAILAMGLIICAIFIKKENNENTIVTEK